MRDASSPTVVLNRYRIERELGRGAMATVFLAQDLQHERQVAVKVLRPELASSVGADRFLQEIKLTAALNHPHILPLLDSGTAVVPDGEGGSLPRPCYVMPLVQGESLRARLDREKQLPVDDAVQIAREVADALEHAHTQGVIHRDIKPENILLQGGHALVADFGVARALDRAGARLTETGLAIGTPAYMSPEQSSGDGVDGRADVYSLGCVLYEMLAGVPPFTGRTVQAILARHSVDPVPPLQTVRPVPAALEATIRKALAKVPADRFATAGHFARAMTEGLEARPASAHTRRTGRRWLVPVAASILLLAGGGGWYALRGTGPGVIPDASIIAVLPFAPVTPDSELTNLGYSLASTVSASLDGVGDIRTVDRLTILGLAQNRGAPLTLKEGAELGRRFGARSVVYGSLARQGNDVRVDVNLYTSDSLVSLARLVVTAPSDSIATLTDSVTWKLLTEVWRRGVPPSPSLTAITTRSVPALRAFLDGEKLLVQGLMDSAARAYRRAFTADTAFWLAYFRYAYVFRWTEGSGADSMADLAWAHQNDLPERERLLLELDRSDSTLSSSLARSRAYVAEYPDYWPGWFQYADFLMHDGGRLGHGLDEQIAALEQTVALNPKLFFAWDHLMWLVLRIRDTTRASQVVDEMARLGSGAIRYEFSRLDYLPGYRLLVKTAASYPVLDSPLMDSVARMIARAGEVPPWNLAYAFAILGFPRAQIELNRRVLALGVDRDAAAAIRMFTAWAWTGLGAWDSADAEFDRYVRTAPAEWGARPAMTAYRTMVFGAWFGAVDSSTAIRWRDRAGRARERFPGSVPDYWQPEYDGQLAAAMEDRAGLARSLQALKSNSSAGARSGARALGAFELALTGRFRAAGDSLAEMVRHSAERLSLAHTTDALYRLAASRWLLAAGDTVAAAEIIRKVEAHYGGHHPTFDPPMYYQLATISELLGRNDDARLAYQEFLQRYDLPMPAHRALVEEARAALARLTHQGDPPASQ